MGSSQSIDYCDRRHERDQSVWKSTRRQDLDMDQHRLLLGSLPLQGPLKQHSSAQQSRGPHGAAGTLTSEMTTGLDSVHKHKTQSRCPKGQNRVAAAVLASPNDASAAASVNIDRSGGPAFETQGLGLSSDSISDADTVLDMLLDPEEVLGPADETTPPADIYQQLMQGSQLDSCSGSGSASTKSSDADDLAFTAAVWRPPDSIGCSDFSQQSTTKPLAGVAARQQAYCPSRPCCTRQETPSSHLAAATGTPKRQPSKAAAKSKKKAAAAVRSEVSKKETRKKSCSRDHQLHQAQVADARAVRAAARASSSAAAVGPIYSSRVSRATNQGRKQTMRPSDLSTQSTTAASAQQPLLAGDTVNLSGSGVTNSMTSLGLQELFATSCPRACQPSHPYASYISLEHLNRVHAAHVPITPDQRDKWMYWQQAVAEPPLPPVVQHLEKYDSAAACEMNRLAEACYLGTSYALCPGVQGCNAAAVTDTFPVSDKALHAYTPGKAAGGLTPVGPVSYSSPMAWTAPTTTVAVTAGVGVPANMYIATTTAAAATTATETAAIGQDRAHTRCRPPLHRKRPLSSIVPDLLDYTHHTAAAGALFSSIDARAAASADIACLEGPAAKRQCTDLSSSSSSSSISDADMVLPMLIDPEDVLGPAVELAPAADYWQQQLQAMASKSHSGFIISRVYQHQQLPPK